MYLEMNHQKEGGYSQSPVPANRGCIFPPETFEDPPREASLGQKSRHINTFTIKWSRHPTFLPKNVIWYVVADTSGRNLTKDSWEWIVLEFDVLGNLFFCFILLYTRIVQWLVWEGHCYISRHYFQCRYYHASCEINILQWDICSTVVFQNHIFCSTAFLIILWYIALWWGGQL